MKQDGVRPQRQRRDVVGCGLAVVAAGESTERGPLSCSLFVYI